MVFSAFSAQIPRCHVITLPLYAVVVITLASQQLSDFDTVGKEYCNHEDFQADCSTNEVIVMKSAVYGRMTLGRCVRIDIGHLGCFHDVLPVLDKFCSGRKSCEVRVSHPDFELSRSRSDAKSSKSCVGEVKSYLQADYSCVEVAGTKKSFCSSSLHTVLYQNEGFLASIATDNTNCGSMDFPWMIQATAGQQIVVYLYDFGFTGSTTSLTTDQQQNSFDEICLPYGYIVEKATRTNKTICGGRQRQSKIFTSNTHHIQLQILRESQRNGKQFLLYYKFKGCLDLPIHKDFSYIRDGENLTVTCTWTKQFWRLTCRESEWNGAIGNCTQTEKKTPQIITSSISISDSTMMILIAGCGLIIVILLIIIFVVFLYRCGAASNRQQSLTYSENSKHYVDQFAAAVSCDPRRYNYCGPTESVCNTTGREFVHIWQRPLPAPLIPTPYSSGHLHDDRETAASETTDHSMQPTLNSNQSATSNTSPKYYVLQPSLST